MFRTAQPGDLPQLTDLFVQAFGDSAAFARTALEQFTGIENVFLAEEDGRIVASMCAVPVTLKGQPGAYYYAVCTDKACRGKGIMTALMEMAGESLAAKGVKFAALIPASASLFDFYSQRGFEKAFAKRTLKRTIRNNLWAVAEFDTITAKGLEAIRRKYAPDSVLYCRDESYVAVLTDLYCGGLTTVATEQGYGLYFKRKERLEFTELFARTDRDAEYLLEAARQKEGVEDAVISLGADQNLFEGEGVVQDYGMIRFFGSRIDLQDTYMRLMLDNE